MPENAGSNDVSLMNVCHANTVGVNPSFSEGFHRIPLKLRRDDHPEWWGPVCSDHPPVYGESKFWS